MTTNHLWHRQASTQKDLLMLHIADVRNSLLAQVQTVPYTEHVSIKHSVLEQLDQMTQSGSRASEEKYQRLHLWITVLVRQPSLSAKTQRCVP